MSLHLWTGPFLPHQHGSLSHNPQATAICLTYSIAAHGLHVCLSNQVLRIVKIGDHLHAVHWSLRRAALNTPAPPPGPQGGRWASRREGNRSSHGSKREARQSQDEAGRGKSPDFSLSLTPWWWITSPMSTAGPEKDHSRLPPIKLNNSNNPTPVTGVEGEKPEL